MRLAEVWTGRESARHVLALIQGLGEGSRTVAAARGGRQYQGWTFDRYVLVLLANTVQLLLWLQANQGLSASKQSKRPDPLPTPDNPNPQQNGQGMTLAGFVRASFLAAHRQRQAEALIESVE